MVYLQTKSGKGNLYKFQHVIFLSLFLSFLCGGRGPKPTDLCLLYRKDLPLMPVDTARTDRIKQDTVQSPGGDTSGAQHPVV